MASGAQAQAKQTSRLQAATVADASVARNLSTQIAESSDDGDGSSSCCSSDDWGDVEHAVSQFLGEDRPSPFTAQTQTSRRGTLTPSAMESPRGSSYSTAQAAVAKRPPLAARSNFSNDGRSSSESQIVADAVVPVPPERISMAGVQRLGSTEQPLRNAVLLQTSLSGAITSPPRQSINGAQSQLRNTSGRRGSHAGGNGLLPSLEHQLATGAAVTGDRNANGYVAMSVRQVSSQATLPSYARQTTSSAIAIGALVIDSDRPGTSRRTSHAGDMGNFGSIRERVASTSGAAGEIRSPVMKVNSIATRNNNVPQGASPQAGDMKQMMRGNSDLGNAEEPLSPGISPLKLMSPTMAQVRSSSLSGAAGDDPRSRFQRLNPSGTKLLESNGSGALRPTSQY